MALDTQFNVDPDENVRDLSWGDCAAPLNPALGGRSVKEVNDYDKVLVNVKFHSGSLLGGTGLYNEINIIFEKNKM